MQRPRSLFARFGDLPVASRLPLALLAFGAGFGVWSTACSGGGRPSRSGVSTAGHNDVARRDAGTSPITSEDPRLGAPFTGTAEAGNRRIRSFDEAKRELLRIYERAGKLTDVYCGCPFGPGLRVDLASCGYEPARDKERAGRIEWEHAVPAAAFGRTFVEWREGSDRCVDGKGKRYKGRNCARTSAEFSRIESDLHNLFPVVGEVNGLRGDLPMGLLDPPDRTPPHHRPTADVFRFGRCESAVERGVFQPRREVRGDLARAYKYMDRSYPERQILDDAHRALFDEWDRQDPPDAWERERNRLIAAKQGNANPLLEPL